MPGGPERARVARVFVGALLGPGHPCRDDAVLLVRELFGNSVRHRGPDRPRRTVTVVVKAGDGVIRVEVTARSGPWVCSRARLTVTRKPGAGLG